jgi:hypothetical protein
MHLKKLALTINYGEVDIMNRLRDPHAFVAVEEFEFWVFYMEDVLDDFLNWLPRDVSERLDYSFQSLDILESWLLSLYPSTEAMLEFGQSEIVDAAARYVGKIYRKAIDGKWDVILDEPDNVYYRFPILRDKNEGHVQDCPLSLTTASADRRTGNYLRTVLENKVSRLAVQKA